VGGLRDRGFVPLTLVGVFLILIAFGWSAHFSWVGHQKTLDTIEDSEISEMDWKIESICEGFKLLLRSSVEKALSYCSEAGSTREFFLKIVSANNFWRGVEKFVAGEFLENLNVEIHLPEKYPLVNFREGWNGQMIAGFESLDDFYILAWSPDNSIRLKRFLGDISVSVPSRYYLLRGLMDNFLRKLPSVTDRWGLMEYAKSWSEALLQGRITLDERVDRGLFEISWALMERDVFGAFDPSGSISSFTSGNPFSRRILVSPVDESKISRMKNYVEKSRMAIEFASSRLQSALDGMRSGVWDNSPENFRKVIQSVISELDLGLREFEQLLTFVREAGKTDSVMLSIYTSLTSPVLNSQLPPPADQMNEGCEKVRTVLSSVERVLFENTWENQKLVLETQLSNLLELPNPRWISVRAYADNPPREVENLVPLYIWSGSPPSLLAIEKVLLGIESDLEKLLEFSAPKLPDFDEVDEILNVKVLSSLPDRELLYKLRPPTTSPSGVGVFHELQISEIEYHREDLAGRIGSSMATPVPLPFINVCFWWGQWKTEVKIDAGLEELIDIRNPTILENTELGYLHMPYVYRHSFSQDSFEITVLVISLKPFTISQS